jgi:hypothetical protein
VAKPHEPDDLRLTVEQWPIYVAGYDMALKMALKVMTLAVKRWQLARATRRKARKLEKSA